jgi:uncharacterized OsmC-like protein
MKFDDAKVDVTNVRDRRRKKSTPFDEAIYRRTNGDLSKSGLARAAQQRLDREFNSQPKFKGRKRYRD